MIKVRRLSQSILALSSTIVLSALLLTSCGGSEERESKYLSRAENHFQEENYEKSEVEVKNVLQINPKNIDARFLLAKIKKEQGEFRDAFRHFLSLSEEVPEHKELNIELAKIYFAGRQDENSDKHIRRVLAQDPNNLEAKVIEAGLLVREGKYDSAKSIANELLKSHPNDPGATAVLVSAEVESDPEKALSIIEDGLAANPDNRMLKSLKLNLLIQKNDEPSIEAMYLELIEDYPEELTNYYKLAQGYSFQKRTDEAEAILNKAILNNPEDFDAKINLVKFSLQNRPPENSENIIKEFIKQQPDNYELKELLAQVYISFDKKDDAKALLRSIVEKQPESYSGLAARNSLAVMLLSEDNRDQAETLLGEIFEIEPSNTQALITRAKLSIIDGNSKDAITDLRTAIKNDPESIEALKLLAATQESEGSVQLALDNYKKILSINSRDQDILLAASRLSLSEGESKNAEMFLNRILSLNPIHVRAIPLAVRLYGNQQRWEEAKNAVKPLLQTEETKALGYSLQASIARGEKNWDDARALYKQALEIEPTTLENVAGYTDSFLVQKDTQSAIKFLETHIENHPQLDYAKDMLAKVYLMENKSDKAKTIYQELINRSENRITAYEKLARIYMSEDKTGEAENTLQKGLSKNPNAESLYIFLANIYESQEAFDKSKAQYEKVLELNPANSIAKNNLAVLLTNSFASEENLNRALELAGPLAETREPVYLDTIGWIHYKMDNIPQAISYLQAAVKSNPNIHEFHYHLGMAYMKKGDKEKAKEHLEQATENDNANYFGAEEALATFNAL